jgi:adenylyltransferase/sulfurtransferase
MNRAPRVALIGAGGLGGPLAYALLAADVDLTVADPDGVELHNLPRQVQYTPADLGRGKAECLRAEMAARGHLSVSATALRCDSNNLGEFARSADILVDASDSPETKFAVSSAATRLGLPCVIAAAIGHRGSVMVSAPGSACYECLFEAPPQDAATCGSAGVMGSTVAVIGGMAAGEIVALLAGRRENAGSVLVFDDLRATAVPRQVRFRPRPGCHCARGVPRAL